MVNLEWYRTFKAVYDTGSLTAASKILFISQPNVSQHISGLEQHIGKLLFERKHKVVPTDYAKLIYAQIVDPIEKLEEVESIFKKMCLMKNRPTINIGTPKEYFHLLATENLKDTTGIIISTFGNSKELLEKLSKTEIDFMLCTEKTDNYKFKFDEILTEELWIVGSMDLDTQHLEQVLASANLTEAELWLLAQNWLTYGSEISEPRRFWSTNFKKRPVFVPHAIIPDYQTILEGVSKGNTVTVASNLLAEQMIEQGRIKVLWKGSNVTKTTLYLAYDPQRAPTEMINLVKDLFKERSKNRTIMEKSA